MIEAADEDQSDNIQASRSIDLKHPVELPSAGSASTDHSRQDSATLMWNLFHNRAHSSQSAFIPRLRTVDYVIDSPVSANASGCYDELSSRLGTCDKVGSWFGL
jgi:hypothetical protein